MVGTVPGAGPRRPPYGRYQRVVAVPAVTVVVIDPCRSPNNHDTYVPLVVVVREATVTPP